MVATDEPARTRTLTEGGWSAITGEVDAPERAPGSRIADYIVLHRIGAGGMGVVYAAYDPHLDRKIALKVLKGGFEAEDFVVARARMIAEGRALARLSHPNVVTVHDVGTVDDEVYIAMELVDGRTLGRWRDEQRPSWQETVAVFLEIADGLAAVHEAGLVHRDVKPDNVLIDKYGRPRVTDFGLARPNHDAPRSLAAIEQAVVDAQETPPLELTQAGTRLGTPAYMAREQLKGNAATAKSDQFAFCVALWECLYGDRPFWGDTWVSLVFAVTSGVVREPPATPNNRAVPAWVRRIVERGLRPEPEERWPSMRELRTALAAGDPNRRRRRRWAAFGGAALLGGGVATFYAVDAAAREEVEAACVESGSAIADTWNADARTRVEAAFAGAGVDDGAATGREIADKLDRFAAEWAEHRTEVCRAAELERSMDPDLASRSVDCLERSRGGLEALVHTFEDADRVVILRAKRSAEGLDDLAECRNEQRLRTLPPLPEDPEVRAEVKALHEELAATLVHEHTGRWDEGLAISRAALARAVATEHLPVTAVAHYRVAVFLEKKGEYEAATEEWVAAFHDAALGGQDQLAAEAASVLAFCEGYQLARHDVGIRWAELSGVYLERLGLGHTLTEATRLDVLAVLLEQKGEYDESIATHERALAIRRQNVGPDHHSIGYGLVNLAGVLEATGQRVQAREHLVEAKRIFEAAFGPDNPTTAYVLHNLGNLQVNLGEYEEAEALLRRAVDIWTATVGPEHPDVGDVHNSLGDLEVARGDYEAAARMHARALEIHQAALAKDHPTIAHTATELGQVLVLLGRLDEAQSRFELALDTLRGKGPDERDRVGRAHHGLATIALYQGDLARAREGFERSIADFEAHPGEGERWIARAKMGLQAVELAELGVSR